MRSGLYAVGSFEGAPIAAADCRELAIPACGDAPRSWAVHARDADPGRSLSIDRAGAITNVLLGHLDEPHDLAAALGCRAETPAVVLASAAFERWGDAAPSRLLGEWSYLRWNAEERALVLMASETCRDPLFYAIGAGAVAVAPDLRVLSGLSWVGRTLDPTGVLLHMGRAPLRRALTTETIVVGVRKVVEGSVVRLSARGVVASAPLPLPAPERWRGSFGDAIAALEATLARSVAQTIERHRQPACLLSGGLDSSLLACLAAEQLPAGRALRCLTSAAAADSGVTDETAYAALVAERLGVPMDRVVPASAPGVFRPSPRWLACATSPVATPWHYLYDALFDAALAGGADVLFDGAIGEATLSAVDEPATLAIALRRLARSAKRSLAGGSAKAAPKQRADAPFHAGIAPGLRGALPPRIAELTAQLHDEMPRRDARPPSDLFGYAVAAQKNASLPTELADQSLRLAMPFRDRRLVTLFAGMPIGYVERHGTTRAPARAMLKGRVPDAIRRRVTGKPFAPDYAARAIAEAPAALTRIALFRAAGIGAWLDLDWLETVLTEMAQGRSGTLDHHCFVAMTAVAAEHLLWWQTI